jgi:F-type H+-transporting ATPase subunit epsilon
MSETIHIRIITPLTVVVEKEAKMITIPGEEGIFGVLPSHAPLIASLGTGLTRIFIDNTSVSDMVYLTSKGVAEVTGSKVDIATEFAIDVTQLSESEISQKILELKK